MYTINNIDADTGIITVTFDCDGQPQTMCNVPLDSMEALDAFLTTYEASYVAGLEKEKPKIGDDVMALVGKSSDEIASMKAVKIPSSELNAQADT